MFVLKKSLRGKSDQLVKAVAVCGKCCWLVKAVGTQHGLWVLGLVLAWNHC